MQRVLVAAYAIAAALFLAAGNARAEDLTGKLGIGADFTSGGAQGGSLRYGLMPKLNLQLLFHFDYTSGPDEASETGLVVGALAHYSIIEWSGLSFDAIGGIDVRHQSEDDGVDATDDPSETDIALEAGFGPNWWITPNLALNLGLSLVVFLDDDDNDAQKATVISLFGVPEIVGGAGFTFWFR